MTGAALTGSAPMRPRWQRRLYRLRRVIPPVIAFVVFVALWQAGVFHRLLHVESYTLAYPSAILDALSEQGEALFAQSVVTLTEAVVGYLLGSSIGLGLAILFVRSDTLRRVLEPIANGINSVPIVAVAP